MVLWVKTLDSVWSECSDDAATQITGLLTYTDIKWTMGQKVKSKVCMLHLTSDDRYFFHTGFVPKVLKHLRKKWKVVYTTEVPTLSHDEPHLDGIVFREYQKAFFPIALAKGRGVLQAATGAGKSIIIGGIMSAFSQEKILFLVHTQDLVTQMMKDLPKWGIKDIGEWTGNARKKARVMCATIQSFSKVVNEFSEYFDVVICDECHHVNDILSLYGHTLQRLAAPIKLGTTATLPSSEKGRMHLEALIGPVIHTLSIKEGVDHLKILSKPRIKIIKQELMASRELFSKRDLPGKSSDDYSEEYPVVYWNGIVKNFKRNIDILTEAKEAVAKGKSVLINVTLLEHIKELQALNTDYFNLSIKAMHGSLKKEERDQIKDDFKSGKVKCVIATSVWREGIDIPNLNMCILAGGGKSELAVLQFIGRGLRRSEGKIEVDIVDFHDVCHYFFENHFNARMKIYKENGWYQ